MPQKKKRTSSRDTLASKYSKDIKERLKQCLPSRNISFDIHPQVYTAIVRLALADLTLYWYVAWHYIRYCIVRWPNIFLPRCKRHLFVLIQSQRAYVADFPIMKCDRRAEMQRREHIRQVLSESRPLKRSVAFSPMQSRAAQSFQQLYANASNDFLTLSAEFSTKPNTSLINSSEFFKDETNFLSGSSVFVDETRTTQKNDALKSVAVARELFAKAADETNTNFALDATVFDYLRYVGGTNNADDGAHNTYTTTTTTAMYQRLERTSRRRRKFARDTSIWTLRHYFEVCFMIISCIVERNGEIFLKRSLINAFISQIIVVNKEFEKMAADKSVQFDDIDKECGSLSYEDQFRGVEPLHVRQVHAQFRDIFARILKIPLKY